MEQQIALLKRELAEITIAAQTASGELLATQAAIRAILIRNPELISDVVHQIEKLTAAALPREVYDSTIDGFDRAKKRILPRTRDLDSEVGP